MKLLEYGKDVQALPLTAEQAKAVPVPDRLSFSVDKEARIEAPFFITLSGELQNDGDEEQVFLTYGTQPFIFSSEDPALELVFSHRGALDLPDNFEIRLPPHSRLRMTTRFDCSLYRYKGQPRIQLAWTLIVNAGTLPQGMVSVQLPRRVQNGSCFYIDGLPVAQGDFEKLRKSLHGEDHWYCKVMADGGETGWVSTGDQNRRYRLVFRQSHHAELERGLRA